MSTLYEIRLGEEAQEELRGLPAFDRERILDAIEEQLRHEPEKATRNRKRLEPRPELSVLGIGWELRVGAFRVFYRVFDEQVLVLILKVTRKGRKTTKEVL